MASARRFLASTSRMLLGGVGDLRRVAGALVAGHGLLERVFLDDAVRIGGDERLHRRRMLSRILLVHRLHVGVVLGGIVDDLRARRRLRCARGVLRKRRGAGGQGSGERERDEGGLFHRVSPLSIAADDARAVRYPIAGPQLSPSRGNGTSLRVRLSVSEGPPVPAPLNVLFITADQWRGDCLSSIGHPVVKTPNLDALAAEGVHFTRHYANTAPCGPSRASLHTGLYLQNHRSHANGTPLDARHTNWALEVKALGYDPVLFGYTDTSVDPRTVEQRRSVAFHLRRAAPRHPAARADGRQSNALDRLAERQGLCDAASRGPGLQRAGGRSRPRRRRAASPPARLSDRGRRHLVPHRAAGRLPGRGQGSVRRPPLPASPAPALRRARAVQCNVRSEDAAGFPSPRERRRGGPTASLAGLAARPARVPRHRQRDAAAPAQGGLLRPDEPGGRRDRLAHDLPPRVGTSRPYPDHLHLRPWRGDRRPLADRQRRLFRRLLPHPADRP